MIDLEAYFKRVGYTGPRDATLATLRELHRLQPQVIAFENLDPLLKRPVKLDAASLEAKLVKGGRGGYCFEQNLLFGARVARARLQGARGDGPRALERAARRAHAARPCASDCRSRRRKLSRRCRVRRQCGDGPLVLKSRDEQTTPHEPFRLVEEEHRVVVEAKIGGKWTSLYATDLAESIPADFEMGNWFTSAHPELIFVNGLLAARAEPGRRYALFNNALSVHKLKDGAKSGHSMRASCAMRLATCSRFASAVSMARCGAHAPGGFRMNRQHADERLGRGMNF